MQKQQLEGKKNFNFIDNIRGISMLLIVLEHSTHIGTYIFEGVTLKNLIYMGVIQLAKSGTIAFFILSGFLISSKFMDYSPVQYFKRRMKTTFVPWLFWSLVFVFAMTYKHWTMYHRNSDFNGMDNFMNSLRLVYLYSNYWFIINFLICIGILLIFRRYLYSYIFGAVLLFLTLVYSINIYFEWFLPHHTVAILGFVFFLWLGAFFNKHWEIISNFTTSTPIWKFLLLFVISFGVSLAEIAFLYNVNSQDPYNTLRLSNIVYSIVVIFMLIKINRFSFIEKLEPRKTTFGIYLIHYIMVYNIVPEILRPFKLGPLNEYSTVVLIGMSLLKFVIAYSSTYLVVRLINFTSQKWLIGR